jgi:DNA-binding CsgD family transcriptional regulator
MKRGTSPQYRARPRTAKSPTAVVREGIVLIDANLRLIALDSGAAAILNDFDTPLRTVDGFVNLPVEIESALCLHPLDEATPVQAGVTAGHSTYSCRRFVMRRVGSRTEEPMLALHITREVSVGDIIQRAAREYHLTDREQEALAGLAIGLTSKKLAERMNVSPNTIKAFLRIIMLKMGAATRAGIVGRLLGHDEHLLGNVLKESATD